MKDHIIPHDADCASPGDQLDTVAWQPKAAHLRDEPFLSLGKPALKLYAASVDRDRETGAFHFDLFITRAHVLYCNTCSNSVARTLHTIHNEETNSTSFFHSSDYTGHYMSLQSPPRPHSEGTRNPRRPSFVSKLKHPSLWCYYTPAAPSRTIRTLIESLSSSPIGYHGGGSCFY
ncbi:hypothetical protein VTN31DRAFT_2821 [Thermomyces dupontii]|uniref:uncharacterized protein n=1 Tax=Talaromyces thermophilus TaxID=28565 RepID=UPI003742B00E